MAPVRKRNSRNNSRRTNTASQGFNPFSLFFLGLILGLAIAVVFYSVFLRNPDTNRRAVGTPPLITSQPQPTSTNKPTVTQTMPVTTPTPSPIQNKKTHDDKIGQLIKKGQEQNKPVTFQIAPKKQSDQIGQLINSSNLQPKQIKPDAATQTQSVAPSASSKQAINEKVIVSKQITPTKQQYLQVGAYQNSADADSMRARVIMLGLTNVEIENTTVNNKPVSRLRMGPFLSDSDLQKAKSLLEKEKISPSVVR